MPGFPTDKYWRNSKSIAAAKQTVTEGVSERVVHKTLVGQGQVQGDEWAADWFRKEEFLGCLSQHHHALRADLFQPKLE